MSIADLKGRTQQIFDLFNAHDAAGAAELFAEDAEVRDVAVARPAVGRAQIARLYERNFAAIPDARVRVDRVVAEGDTVVAEWTNAGTHGGRLMGIPPTGKAVSVKGISVLRYRGGLVISDTRVWDLAGLLRQIGLLPDNG